MTVEHRDFDGTPDATEEEVKEPSCTFTLGGRTWTCRNRDDVPWNLMQHILTVDDEGTAVVVVEPFFRGALIPADVDAFVELLNDPASALTEAKVKPIVEFITAKVTGRPTKPSSGSRRGSGKRKRSSAGGSSSPDTTPLASVG